MSYNNCDHQVGNCALPVVQPAFDDNEQKLRGQAIFTKSGDFVLCGDELMHSVVAWVSLSARAPQAGLALKNGMFAGHENRRAGDAVRRSHEADQVALRVAD